MFFFFANQNLLIVLITCAQGKALDSGVFRLFFIIYQCLKFGQFLRPLPSTVKNGSKICCDIIKGVQCHVRSMTFSGIRAGIMPDACVVFRGP